jgi:S-adenosylmethionine synthetase
MRRDKYVFTSESVTEGHPDKVCDQISDAVLDAILKDDPMGRVACESFVTTGLVVVGGEITTNTWVDVPSLVRSVIAEIGYTDRRFGFDSASCGVLNAIGRQSPDISQGVDTGGAGDQGLMVGFACDETKELMPTPISLAHNLTRRLAEARKKKILPYLGPDGKSQVTVEYEDGHPRRIDAVVISSQHDVSILDRSGKKITNASREEMIEKFILPVLPKNMLDKQTKFYVNPTGNSWWADPKATRACHRVGKLSWTPTAVGPLTEAVRSAEKIPPKWIARPATWRATWRKILWPPDWPSNAPFSWRMLLAWPTRSA